MQKENSPFLEPWWTDWQNEIVLDTSRVWEVKVFKKSAGYQFPANGGGTLVGKISDQNEIPPNVEVTEGIWDHEHCGLCWTTISEQENDQHKGYTDGKDWVCAECYDKYILPHRTNSHT